MMEEEEEKKPLHKYLKRGEGEQIEYKQTLNDEYKIAKTICALANTKGGILLIGVKDDKTILGVDPEEEKHFLLNASQFRCQPPIPLNIEEVYVPDYTNWAKEKAVLKVEIFESDQKPHYAESKNGKWTAYLRLNDKTMIAGEQAVNLMRLPSKTEEVLLTKNEKRLMDFLQKNERITLKKYTDLVNISTRRARRELQDALNKGVIRILEHEKENYYVK